LEVAVVLEQVGGYHGEYSMPTKPILRLSEPEFQNWTRNYSAEEKLATGESLRVRAARPDDQARLLDHLEHLSPASLRSRFFAIKENFTEQLAQLANADFANVVLLLATMPGADDEEVKGFAAYALREPSSSVAELAITVADADHHHGIGTLLLDHLTRIARRAGVAVLEASVLSQNRAALAVLAHHGFHAESYEDPNVVRFKRNLLEPPPER
jgi:GNAT superfamily N-acetyltransferase